jgi:hypothetical protein
MFAFLLLLSSSRLLVFSSSRLFVFSSSLFSSSPILVFSSSPIALLCPLSFLVLFSAGVSKLIESITTGTNQHRMPKDRDHLLRRGIVRIRRIHLCGPRIRIQLRRVVCCPFPSFTNLYKITANSFGTVPRTENKRRNPHHTYPSTKHSPSTHSRGSSVTKRVKSYRRSFWESSVRPPPSPKSE